MSQPMTRSTSFLFKKARFLFFYKIKLSKQFFFHENTNRTGQLVDPHIDELNPLTRALVLFGFTFELPGDLTWLSSSDSVGQPVSRSTFFYFCSK